MAVFLGDHPFWHSFSHFFKGPHFGTFYLRSHQGPPNLAVFLRDHQFWPFFARATRFGIFLFFKGPPVFALFLGHDVLPVPRRELGSRQPPRREAAGQAGPGPYEKKEKRAAAPVVLWTFLEGVPFFFVGGVVFLFFRMGSGEIKGSSIFCRGLIGQAKTMTASEALELGFISVFDNDNATAAWTRIFCAWR